MNAKPTVLLVEDLESDRMLMRAAILRAKFPTSLQMVHDGEQAIAYLKGEGAYSDRAKYPLPVAVLLDLNLPKVNGFDVLAWMHSQPKLKRIHVIVLSASARSGDVDRAYDLGASGFLVKPPAFGQLTTMTLRLRDWLEINHFPPTE